MRLSLHVLLLVALGLAVSVPAVAFACGWLGAGAWQASREASRERQAIEVLRAGRCRARRREREHEPEGQPRPQRSHGAGGSKR